RVPQDERAARTEEQDATKRKLESFVRLFSAERERQAEAVKHALQQMGDRTRELTALARQIQQEGVVVRVAAAKVHEEASMGIKVLEDRYCFPPCRTLSPASPTPPFLTPSFLPTYLFVSRTRPASLTPPYLPTYLPT
ncbi:hypothetical protein T484DRAFT_3647108, partial [Baffinella frigidus]